MPLDERGTQRFGYLERQDSLARPRLALDQQGTLERDGSVDRHFQIVGGDVGLGSLEFH